MAAAPKGLISGVEQTVSDPVLRYYQGMHPAPLSLLAGAFPEGILPAGHLDQLTSILLVYVLIGGAFVAWSLVQLIFALRHGRRARRAKDSYQGEAPLKPGPAILYGAVEYAAGQGRAVRVEADQYGEEHENSGSWTTKWSERDRRVMVAPFYLRLANKQRVRVEPTEEVFLVDDMDGVIRVDLTSRIRVAELIPGEMTYAVGQLESGTDPEAEDSAYRGGGRRLLLRARPGRPLYLSTRPLGDSLSRKARFDGLSAAIILLAGIVLQLIWTGFHARLWVGQTMEREVSGLHHFTTTDSDGDTYNHWRVTVAAEPGQAPLYEDVSVRDYLRLSKGMKVPWRVVPGLPDLSAIGTGATVSAMSLMTLVFLIPAMAIFYLVRRGLRPWYEKDEIVDAESGRLAERYFPEA